MILKPDKLSSSHEGPHLVRPYDTAVFTVFFHTYKDHSYLDPHDPRADRRDTGWYWESSTEWDGPYRTSCLAYLGAKGQLLPPVVVPRKPYSSYNPRHLPVTARDAFYMTTIRNAVPLCSRS